MTRSAFAAVTFASMLASGACDGSPSEPSTEPGVLTDRATYVARHVGGAGIWAEYELEVEATFVNRTNRVVFVHRCTPEWDTPIYGVYRPPQPDEALESAFNAAWGCVGHDEHFAVLPRASRTWTLRIRGPQAREHGTGQVLGALEGAMYLVLPVSYCRDCNDMVPAELTRSEPFRVTLEPID